MGNGRKQTALWLVFVEGAALSLGIYLLLTVLLSALVVKAVLPEEGSFPAVAASCCLASFAGAMLSVRRSSWGSLASAMVSASTFLMAEPLSRTATSLPESIMRTSWSAASPPPMFMFPHLLLVFFCFLDVLLHYRRLLADLPAELPLFPLCPDLPIHL